MNVLEQLKTLTSKQRSTVIACFLVWTLDAFDFFILVFVIKDIAKEFGTNVTAVTFTLFLTLAMRPLANFQRTLGVNDSVTTASVDRPCDLIHS